MKLTLLLILINVGVFIYTFQNLPYFIENYGFSSNSFEKGNYLNVVTAMFMHKNLLHLVGNMVVLFFVGKEVEKRVNALVYLFVYFLSGLIANLGVVLLPLVGINATVIGASAAISGIIGYGAFKFSGKWILSPIRFIPIPMPFILVGAIYAFINFAGVLIFQLSAMGHLIGGVVGAFFGLVGEQHKFRKITIFFLLIAFISLLPYLIRYIVTLWI
ncbi:MAG: rhomboid family intramembrane serine protease [Candidatus Aenigmatarchaeota archaeon]